MTALFCNGEGMRSGAVHENLAGEAFLGEATTAPPEERERHRDITAFGGWRAYRPSSG